MRSRSLPSATSDHETFPFESRMIDCRRGAIHYVDEGSGPVLLLLHPAAGTLYIYKRMILQLRERFRVIAPDLFGFGLSRADDDFEYTLDAYADSINDFVRALEIHNVTLLVNDTSGPIGLGAATREPNLYRSFIITDTFGFPLRGRFAIVRFMLRRVLPSWPIRALNRKLNLLAWAVSTVAPYRNPLPRADRRTYQGFFRTTESRDRIIDLFHSLGSDETFLPSVEAGIRAHLAQKKTLLLYGQFDPVRLIGFLARFRELFPTAQQAIISGEEHFPILGSAAAVAKEIDIWYDREFTPEQQAEWSKVGAEKASV